jgi:hypothetical protein
MQGTFEMKEDTVKKLLYEWWGPAVVRFPIQVSYRLLNKFSENLHSRGRKDSVGGGGDACGRESQGSWRQDELIGGKPPVM